MCGEDERKKRSGREEGVEEDSQICGECGRVIREINTGAQSVLLVRAIIIWVAFYFSGQNGRRDWASMRDSVKISKVSALGPGWEGENWGW